MAVTERTLFDDRNCTVVRYGHPESGNIESVYALVSNNDPSSPIANFSVSISRATEEGETPSRSIKDFTFELYAGLKPDHTEKTKWHALRAMFPDPASCLQTDRRNFKFFTVYAQSGNGMKRPAALARATTYDGALDILAQQHLITAQARQTLEHVIPMMLGSPELIETDRHENTINTLLDTPVAAARSAVALSMKEFYARSPA